MMSMKKKVLTLAAMVAALAASSVMAADVSYTSVLSGKVDSVVPVGTTVAEGDVLYRRIPGRSYAGSPGE